MSKEIYLLGYGINFYEQRNINVDIYLEQADIIFAIEPDITHIKEFLTIDKPIQNLFYLYENGAKRINVYNRICELILDSFQENEKVALLVEGSPFFLDTISETIENKVKISDIDLHVVEGISSLDTIIHQLKVPILNSPISVYLADEFCNKLPILDMNTTLFLFQPGNVNSNCITIENISKNSIIKLKDTLLKYYSGKTKWLLINLGKSPTQPTQIIWNTIENLDSFINYMHSGTLIITNKWCPSILKNTEPTVIEGHSS